MSSSAARGLPLQMRQPEGASFEPARDVTRDRWIHARVTLLEREKAQTKARDKLAAERRRLPMVEVAEDYRFSAADGSTRTLLDLFEGRHQLFVDHYMFDPDWEDGHELRRPRHQYGNTAHLHERDTTIAVVSRAPIEKIERWKHKMGWTFPWYSSYGSRFNFDYGVSFDDTVDDPVTTIVPSPRSPRRTIWPRSRHAARHEHVPSRRRSRLPYLQHTGAAPRRWAARTTTSI